MNYCIIFLQSDCCDPDNRRNQLRIHRQKQKERTQNMEVLRGLVVGEGWGGGRSKITDRKKDIHGRQMGMK